jgi:hypothetical protein
MGKWMKMKTLTTVFLSLAIVGLVSSVGLSGVLISKQGKFKNLDANFQQLQNSFTTLEDTFSILQTNYSSLEDDYNIICGENDELDELYQEIYDSYQGLLADYVTLNDSYTQLNQSHNLLSSDYSDLSNLYTQLQITYSQLVASYAALNSLYLATNANLNLIINNLRVLPYLDKLKMYYHFCRIVYGEPHSATYFNPNYTPLYDLCKNIILHASKQANYFTKIDDLLGVDFWDGQTSMDYAWDKMFEIFGPIPYWFGGATQNIIHNWVNTFSGLVYQSDDTLDVGRQYNCDYSLSPVETFSYNGGDCEDFSILCGTMLENNGHDVGFVAIQDDIYYPGSLRHAWLWVNIDYNLWLGSNINNPIWSFDGGATYQWIVVDPTPGWQLNIWWRPMWLDWYMRNGITAAQWLSLCYAAVCDP